MRAMPASRVSVLIVAVCALLLAGCDDLGMTVSLHPIAAEEQPQFEPALLGQWLGVEDDEVLVFEKTPAGQFRMLIFRESEFKEDPDATPRERYVVQAVRLGRFIFLDLTSPEDSGDDVLQMRVHIFARLDLTGDEFEVALLNDRWLKRAIAEKRVDVAHEIVDEQVVITAPPAALRQFLERNGWDNEAFPPDGRYRRRNGQ